MRDLIAMTAALTLVLAVVATPRTASAEQVSPIVPKPVALNICRSEPDPVPPGSAREALFRLLDGQFECQDRLMRSLEAGVQSLADAFADRLESIDAAIDATADLELAVVQFQVALTSPDVVGGGPGPALDAALFAVDQLNITFEQIDQEGDLTMEKQARLQMYLEPLNMSLQMMSNVLKKAASTSTAITQAIK